MVQLLYVVHRIVDSLLGNLERPGNPSGSPCAIGLLLLQPLDLPVFRHDYLLEGAGPSLDHGCAVLEGLVAEDDDLAMLAADLVCCWGAWGEGMCNRKSEDVVAAVAAAEVQGHGALIVGLVEVHYGDAKGWPNSMTSLSTRGEGAEGREIGDWSQYRRSSSSTPGR